MMTLLEQAACIAVDNELWEEMYNRGLFAAATITVESILQQLTFEEE